MAADGEKAAVRLLGGRMSPFTMRARMALELRGVAYELVEERFEPRKSDRLLAANPVYEKIPVLILPDGRAVCESALIAQYADEACPTAGSVSGSAVLPEDPYERAMHRFWTAYVDDKFWPALDAASLAPTQEAQANAVAEVRAALRVLEEAFAARSDGGAFFSGRDAVVPGLLDIALGCFLPALRACERLRGIALLDEATPLLKKWSETFAGSTAARAVLPETEEVIEFTRFLQVWFDILSACGMPQATPSPVSNLRQWLRETSQLAGARQRSKAVRSMVALTAWNTWKLRNASLFRNARPDRTDLVQDTLAEAQLWQLAGAKDLALLPLHARLPD